MFAGLIVTTIGLALVAGEIWHLPRYWSTVAVGMALFAFGALRRVLGPAHSPRGEER